MLLSLGFYKPNKILRYCFQEEHQENFLVLVGCCYWFTTSRVFMDCFSTSSFTFSWGITKFTLTTIYPICTFSATHQRVICDTFAVCFSMLLPWLSFCLLICHVFLSRALRIWDGIFQAYFTLCSLLQFRREQEYPIQNHPLSMPDLMELFLPAIIWIQTSDNLIKNAFSNQVHQ